MEHELTPQQAREILGLRSRHSNADLVVHPRPWGLIVEARRGNHAVELMRFDWNGASERDRRIKRRRRTDWQAVA